MLLVWHFSTRLGKPWAPLVVLSVGSVIFYAIWNHPLVFLLLRSIGVNYALGRALRDASRRGLLLAVGITTNVVLQGVFKYAGFFCRFTVEHFWNELGSDGNRVAACDLVFHVPANRVPDRHLPWISC